jgi:hypothetical protein
VCVLSRPRIAGIYRAGGTGAQATAPDERTRVWLLANLFQAVSSEEIETTHTRSDDRNRPRASHDALFIPC